MYVRNVLKVAYVLRTLLVVVAASAGLTTSTSQDGTTHNPLPCNKSQYEYTESDTIPCDSVQVALQPDAEVSWQALLLPFLVGMGILKAVLLHTAVFYIIGTLKNQPEKWRQWRMTAAGTMGVMWSVQMMLIVGLVAVSLRMLGMMRDGTFASASSFSAFYPGHAIDTLLPPIIYATPIVFACYWSVLTILCNIEEKKKRRKEELESVEKNPLNTALLPVTNI